MIDNLKLSYLTFQEIAKTLQKLSEEQFQSLADGRARIEISFDNQPAMSAPISVTGSRAKDTKQGSKITVEAAAKAIKEMTRSEDVIEYLKRHERTLTIEKLNDLAVLLGPTVSLTSGARKAQLWQEIANGTTGYKEQSAVMLPGGFR